MKIDIVIPTYRRAKKLKRCLDSIIAQTHIDWSCCVIVNGGDKETFDLLIDYEAKDDRIWFKSPATSYVIDSWNYYFRNFTLSHIARTQDAVAWIVDDVELFPNYLEELAKSMEANYPDLDGVIGAKQICPGRDDYKFKWFGQVLIGKKFIERYKDVHYQVCCPFYTHFFQDEELWTYANSLGKFINCESAVLKHFHPAFVPEEMDETHSRIRDDIKRNDQSVHELRLRKNLIWGQSWQEK